MFLELLLKLPTAFAYLISLLAFQECLDKCVMCDDVLISNSAESDTKFVGMTLQHLHISLNFYLDILSLN